MISITDIYHTIDSNLVEQNFWESNFKQKKKLLDDELKKYIISKLCILQNVPADLNDLNIDQLLTLLARKIPREEHFNTLRHFTHYILQIAGQLQGWSITWYGEYDQNLIADPVISFNENDLWDSLTTYAKDDETDYVKVFNFVYDVFCNNFMVRKSQKKLTMPVNNNNN